MAVGLATVAYANKVLDHMHRAVASTAPAGNFVRLHTGDPGAAGTANGSANTTRVAVTFAAASAGAIAQTGTAPSWATWAAGTETITHISVWDASTGGTFLYSIQLTQSKQMTNGDTLNLTNTSVSLAPLAA